MCWFLTAPSGVPAPKAGAPRLGLPLSRPPPWASPEVEVLEREVGLHDASGFDPGSEDVLLGGLVVGGPNPVQAVQVAGDGDTKWTMSPAARWLRVC